jgi:hypothetical protein
LYWPGSVFRFPKHIAGVALEQFNIIDKMSFKLNAASIEAGAEWGETGREFVWMTAAFFGMPSTTP